MAVNVGTGAGAEIAPPVAATRQLPPDMACFTPVSEADSAALLGQLSQRLRELHQQREFNPFANTVQLLALEIMRQLDQGELTPSALEQLIQTLTVASFQRRSERIRRYLGELGRAANLATLRGLIEALARDPESGERLPFARFKAAVERDRFGVVITAHPTFSLARGLQELLLDLALCEDEGEGGRAALLAQAGSAEHRPDAPLDLDEEHRQSVAAICNLHRAQHRLYRLVFEVAEAAYPEHWTELNPRLLTIASWVGYDLDGRSDIPWTTSFAKRLRVQMLQLERYREEARALRALVEPATASGVADLLELLEARLALAIKQAQEETAIFEAAKGQDPAAWRRQLAAAARAMHAGRAARMVDATQLIDLIERALRASEAPALRRGLCVLRAEIRTHGLGLAHTHTRINARQLHNAIRKTIGMEHGPDDPSHRLSYLTSISQLVEEVTPQTINFGSLLTEKATAKRVFMIIAQMLKYIDATQPIRFLIAECETGFTLLTALYFAKLFGVADKIEISPLFETNLALEQGHKVVAEALGVGSFRDYVRRQGRLCIQTGFSDAGRAQGQIAAAYAIEQLRLAVGRELARQGLGDIELVIFDTHGESIGRGAHPESFADRLAYVDTPATRLQFDQMGIAYKEEVSFQGGDGYAWFMTENAALAVLTRILEHCLTPPTESGDPFYSDTTYIHEFFTIIRRFNQAVMDNPCFAALLGAYGPNMLPKAGSRPVKRQHDSWSGQVSLEHPSQMRAIPQNAILQQLGYLANSLGGVGHAIAKDPERFARMYEQSPRFRRLMTLVEHAFKHSDLAVLKAYIDLFDPGLWLVQAARRDEATRAEQFAELAAVMERADLHVRLTQIWRELARDYMALADALRDHRRRTRDAGAEPIAVDAAGRDIMHQLHAVRLALMQELYLLATRVPEFSGRHELTREAVIAWLIQLDVDAALATLGTIFPLTDSEASDEDFGEPADYRSNENQSYGVEHAQIFRPIGRFHTLIRRVSAAVIHNVGAIG